MGLGPLDPQLLGSGVVMNIIDVIARVDPPCALVPPGFAPEEQMLQNWSACKRGMYTNVYCWGTEFRD